MLTGFTGNGGVSGRRVPAKDLEALNTYLGAHALLPPGMPDSGIADPGLIGESLEVLGDDEASPEALIEAIVVLGHTPSMTAHDALRRHAASTRPLASIAGIAADECLDWIAQFRRAQRAGDGIPVPPSPTAGAREGDRVLN
jgi:hypothetical protein